MNSEIEQARLQSIALERSRTAIKDKIAKKDKKKDKKKKKKQVSSSESELNMSEIDAAELNGAAGNDIPSEMLPSQNRLREDSVEMQEENERRKNREPAIIFKDVDVSDD